MMNRFFITLLTLACVMFSGHVPYAEAQSSDPVVETTSEDSPLQSETDPRIDSTFEHTFLESEEGTNLHSEAEIESAYRAVKRNESYQYDLADPIPRKDPHPFWKAIGRFFAGVVKIFFPLLEIVFYLGIGALVVGAVYLIGRAVYETRFAKPEVKTAAAPEVPLYQPAEAQARILLDEVDKLAAEGRYGEAVHTLLFRSIQDIDRNRPNVVRRSLTAREIGSLSVLTPEARIAFSTIAGVSELAHFGGVLVNKAGFETARNAYADLTGQTTSAPRRARR